VGLIHFVAKKYHAQEVQWKIRNTKFAKEKRRNSRSRVDKEFLDYVWREGAVDDAVSGGQ
jgi:hypothetical protein